MGRCTKNACFEIDWNLFEVIWKNCITISNLKTLWIFLLNYGIYCLLISSSTSVSPLLEAFVNIPEPLATDVDVDTYFNSDPAITIDFEDVPVEKMEQIEPKFKEVINKVLHIDGPEKFDMDRMHTISKYH